MCFVMGVVGCQLAYSKGQLFREGVFQFMTSFSLPWYAIVGAEVGVQVGLPIWGSLALAVVGPTAGRWTESGRVRGWPGRSMRPLPSTRLI